MRRDTRQLGWSGLLVAAVLCAPMLQGSVALAGPQHGAQGSLESDGKPPVIESALITVMLPAPMSGANPVQMPTLKATPTGAQSSPPTGSTGSAASSGSSKKKKSSGGLGSVDPNATKPTVQEGTTAIAIRGKPPTDPSPLRKSIPELHGEYSGDEENGDNDPDPEPEWLKKAAPGRTDAMASVQAAAVGTRLKDYPKAKEMVDGIVHGLKQMEIDVTLLGGHKYMINDCLGLKASAGKFKLKLANPETRWDGTGARVTFRIDKIVLNALKVRMRPRVHPLKPCKFSGKFEVGGKATKVSYEMRLDPLLDLQQCKLGSLGEIREKWRIGGLNLKPLQNNLDNVAKNMIEDGLTYASNFNLGNQIVAGINGFLGTQCHR